MKAAVVECCVLVFALQASAETISVCLDGSCDHDTIQGAIAASNDGDVIEVAAGTYWETLNTLGKRIELRGMGLAVDTILESPDGHRMLMVNGGERASTIFSDLTFTGGVDEVLVEVNASSPTFERCIFRDNLWRAAMDWSDCGNSSGSTYSNCLFLDNEEPNGGAYRSDRSNPTFIDSAFVGNRAVGPTGGVNAGGAMYIDDWECGGHVTTLTRCVFVDNQAVWGGAIYSQGIYSSAASNMTVEECVFVDNSATQGRSMWNWYMTVPVSDTWFCAGDDQIRHSWADQGGNTFASSCDGAPLADSDGDDVPDALGIMLGLARDCNGNAVPDTADIASGESSDANNNQVPDECECLADFDGDGRVDGYDLSLLLAYWQRPDLLPQIDLNADDEVDAQDLALLLGSWGDCP